jgi:hypothetical protein
MGGARRASEMHTEFSKNLKERGVDKSSSMWENNSKIDLIATGYGSVNWIHAVQERDRWYNEYGNEFSGSPPKAGNFVMN